MGPGRPPRYRLDLSEKLLPGAVDGAVPNVISSIRQVPGLFTFVCFHSFSKGAWLVCVAVRLNKYRLNYNEKHIAPTNKCCVCGNSRGSNRHLRFHVFPRNAQRQVYITEYHI